MSHAHTQSDPSTDYTDLTAFQRDILWVLAAEERYGLAIKRALENLRDESVNHGRLYPNLDTLVETGYVEKYEIDRRTNGYRLTDTGRDRLRYRLRWQRQQLGGDGQ